MFVIKAVEIIIFIKLNIFEKKIQTIRTLFLKVIHLTILGLFAYKILYLTNSNLK